MMKDCHQLPRVLPSPQVLFLFFMGATVFLYLRIFLFPAVPYIATGDEVLFLLRALRILHGQVLYRDFLEIVAPGTDLLYAAVFRLFGVHFWVLEAWSIVFGLICSLVITSISQKILRGSSVLLPALLFLVFDFSSALDLTHHWYSTLASLLVARILMEELNLLRIAGAGFFCGVAALFTQTQGALTLLAVFLYLLWCRRYRTQSTSLLRQLGVLVLPFAFVIIAVLGYYIRKAGFHLVFFDLILFPAKYMSSAEVNTPSTYLHQFPTLHGITDLVRLIPYLFIYVLVPYIYFLGSYRLWRTRKVLSPVMRKDIVLLHLVGIALFLSIAHGPRYFRLCTVAPPAILLCVWLISSDSKAQVFSRRLLWCMVALFAFLLPIYRQLQWHATLNLPVGSVAFSDRQMFQEYRWISQRTHPPDPFFNDINLCFYLGLDNPTASEFVNYDEFSRPEQVLAVIQSLQKRPPRFIMLLPRSPYYQEVHDHSAPFLEYVHENYHLAKAFPVSHESQEEELWERNGVAEAE